MIKMKNPPHPGRILKEDILDFYGLTVTEAAKKLGVGRQSLSKIINERGGISAEMALRIHKVFSTPPELWLNLQTAYDLSLAEKKVNLEGLESVA